MRQALFIIMATFSLALASIAMAVQPDEVLKDPELEARARALSSELRCLVCQNQSIDGSDAELAKDLRLLVRKRLVEGDSDEEVMDYIVSRYGDFVLLKPSFTPKNYILWLTPVIIFALGGLVAFFKFRNPSRVTKVTALSDDEKSKLKQILDE